MASISKSYSEGIQPYVKNKQKSEKYSQPLDLPLSTKTINDSFN